MKEKLQKLKQNIKSRQKGQTFHFSPFSRKQKQVLTWWCKDSPVHDKDGIIADGAIRSGKTVSMSLSFVMWAMSTFNGQNFAMCGKSIGSFRRNVLFWLKLMLKSRGYSVTDRRADNLIIIRKGDTENYFYIFGGKDERSQDLIQGITLAGVFFRTGHIIGLKSIGLTNPQDILEKSRWSRSGRKPRKREKIRG